jgi:hypothetical protein
MTTTRAGQTRTSVFDSRNWQIRIDWSDSTPDIMRATNSMSLFIPPESLVYYPTHIQHAHQVGDLDTHLRVFLFVVQV